MGRRTRFFEYCNKHGLVQYIEDQLRYQADWMSTQQIADTLGNDYKKLPLDVYRICRLLQYLKHNNKVENKILHDHTYVWRLKVN